MLKSASSSAESRAEDERVAEPTCLADRTGNLADGPVPEFPDDEEDPASEVLVSEHKQKLLTSVFAHTMTNTERRKMRQEFLVPNVDNTMKVPKKSWTPFSKLQGQLSRERQRQQNLTYPASRLMFWTLYMLAH